MSDICIKRSHNCNEQEVREKVQALIEKLVGKYGGHYIWEGNRANYHCSGVTADLCFDERELNVEVKLGLLMKAFKSVIEGEINQYMEKNGMN